MFLIVFLIMFSSDVYIPFRSFTNYECSCIFILLEIFCDSAFSAVWRTDGTCLWAFSHVLITNIERSALGLWGHWCYSERLSLLNSLKEKSQDKAGSGRSQSPLSFYISPYVRRLCLSTVPTLCCCHRPAWPERFHLMCTLRTHCLNLMSYTAFFNFVNFSFSHVLTPTWSHIIVLAA